MASETPSNWPDIGRHLGLTASLASSFLDLSLEQRADALRAPQPGWLPARIADHLAEAICQARELVSLLEEAELSWLDVLVANSKQKLSDGAKRQ